MFAKANRRRFCARLTVAAMVVVCLACGLTTNSASLGCDMPVYRYALENWTAADYELLRIRVGAPSTQEDAAWKRLEELAAGSPSRPNVRLRATTPEQLTEPVYQPVLASLGDARHSRLALISPEGPAPRRLIWQGDCTRENAAVLFQSPTRQEIGRRLLDGDAAIWVWVSPAKEPTSDESARLQLETVLTSYGAAAAEVAAATSLVVPGESTAADATTSLPLRFSVLRVAADDPREVVLLSMLRAVLPESAASERPIVFPVFGRGRVLAGIPMQAVDERTVRSACDFLTGACSCEIKDKNPGLDLLLSADYSGVKSTSAPSQLFSLLALEPETPDAAPGQAPPVGAATPRAAASPSVAATHPTPSPRETEPPGSYAEVSADSATSGAGITGGLLWTGMAVTVAACLLMAIVWRFTARV